MTGVAVGSEVGSGVGDKVAVGVEVEVELGDGAADKGVLVSGAGGLKGEQPSPIMATTPTIQTATQNLLKIEDTTDKRFIAIIKT